MELTQLQYFLAVANTGKITTAAQNLHISQSAISMSIAKLEAELGVSLFEKNGRLITLTKDGETFRQKVSTPLAELDFAKNEIMKSGPIDSHLIRLSVEFPDFSTRYTFLFHRLHPDAQFQQSMSTTAATKEKLKSMQVDFVLGFEPIDDPQITSILLIQEPALIQLSNQLPFASASSLYLEELKDVPFISFSSEYSFRRWTDGMCYFAGFKPHISFEVVDTSSLIFAVSKLQGATFITESTANWTLHQQAADYTVIPLKNAFCSRTVYLSFHNEATFSDAATRFLQFSYRFKSIYETNHDFAQTEAHILADHS